MAGTFIVLEGIDGAGTTTQARLLVEWMRAQGLPAHLTCEPSHAEVGELLRRILRHQAPQNDAAVVALLFAADRLDHLRREVEPLLARGVHVVSDRYVYSSLAYQSLELDAGFVAAANQLAREPDLTLFLHVPPAQAALRRKQRGGAEELFETEETQRRVHAGYEALFGEGPREGCWVPSTDAPGGFRCVKPASRAALRRCGRTPSWANLDGAQSIDELHRQIRDLVKLVLSSSIME